MSEGFEGDKLVVDISFCFFTGIILSFYISSELYLPLFSWGGVTKEDGYISGGVIMSIVSVGGGKPVGGGLRGCSCF